MQLDRIDRNLLNRLQAEFPITSRPYASLGEDFNITEDEVIRRIQQLKTSGLIRVIGPLLNIRKLDYRTTLVAMRVLEPELDKAAQIITNHPGISHAYERNHHFNLWFTMAVPSSVDMDTALKEMFSTVNTEAVFSLPALKLFKLRVFFDSGGDEQIETTQKPERKTCQPENGLSPADRAVINQIQQDLPLIPRPFSDMAERAGLDEEEFLKQCQSLLSRETIRRFSASINHRKVGFEANTMTCWIAPEEKVEMAGQKLSSLTQVSHCYERKTNPLWKYNLFAMIHGQSREECQQLVEKESINIGLAGYVMLFSTREIKKTRIKYAV
ncbi:AsnC family transcriptional regulator [Chloroflexota bacterium]